MKDEIKEMLEALRDSIDDTGTDKVNFINWVDKIEDYITNLQEELKSANESITWWQNRFNAKNNGFKSTVKELCETTEKLEKLQDKYEKMKENAEILSKGYSDLEKRNEKTIEDIDLVIELIKQQPTEDDTWILNKLNGFKYLLNGGDDNE